MNFDSNFFIFLSSVKKQNICFCRESLRKGKDQYSWPPCPNLLISAAFHAETIFLQNNLSSWGGQLYWTFPFSKASLVSIFFSTWGQCYNYFLRHWNAASQAWFCVLGIFLRLVYHMRVRTEPMHRGRSKSFIRSLWACLTGAPCWHLPLFYR